MERFEFIDAIAGATVIHDAETGELYVRKGDGSLPEATSVFFPGCSMVNYAMPLLEIVYDTLTSHGSVDGISVLCCGKILMYEADGDVLRPSYERDLIERLAATSIKRIVLACPNCMLALRNCLMDDPRTADIELVTLPQELVRLGYRVKGSEISEIVKGDGNASTLLCIHDSCPDRQFGEYAEGLRDILPSNFWADPLHSRSRSVCCGSLPRAAGKIEQADKCADLNGTEALQVSADALVTSCMSCAFQLNAAQHHVPAYHFLEFLYGRPIDWAAAPYFMKVRFLIDDYMGATTLDDVTARKYASLDSDFTMPVLGGNAESGEEAAGRADASPARGEADDDLAAASSVTISNADTESIIV